MLTLFSSAKPFIDSHFALIQRNAITSWTLLRPQPEIILFGDDVGTAEICKELNVQHVKKVTRNKNGTILLNSIYQQAHQLASFNVMAWINADVILMRNFLVAIEQARVFPHPFFLTGGRWDLDIKYPVNFTDPKWESLLTEQIKKRGCFSFWGYDYVVFSKDLYQDMPPLAIGAGWVDGWLFQKAKQLKAAIIDASTVVTALHQTHVFPYGTINPAMPWREQENQENFRLSGVSQSGFLLEANYKMTTQGLKRIWGRKLVFFLQRLFIYHLGPLRNFLGLRLSNFKRAQRRLSDLLGKTRGAGR